MYVRSEAPEAKTDEYARRQAGISPAPTVEQRWRRRLLCYARDSIEMADYFTRDYGPDWKTFATPEEIKLAEQALESWRTLLELLKAAEPEAVAPGEGRQRCEHRRRSDAARARERT
jgi:hypothetical protein